MPVSSGEQLSRGLPRARLEVLEPAGHQFHSEQFETVLRLVLEFVGQVEASSNSS